VVQAYFLGKERFFFIDNGGGPPGGGGKGGDPFGGAWGGKGHYPKVWEKKAEVIWFRGG